MDEWENWETVSIEAELDRLSDEKEQQTAPATAPTATGTSSNVGCGAILLYLFLGVLLLRLVTELLSFFL
jgi:hypothetical protein